LKAGRWKVAGCGCCGSAVCRQRPAVLSVHPHCHVRARRRPVAQINRV